jgi:amino acid permease
MSPTAAILSLVLCMLLVAVHGFNDRPHRVVRDIHLHRANRHILPEKALAEHRSHHASQPTPGAQLPTSVINLTKNAVGAGVFSLSAKLLALLGTSTTEAWPLPVAVVVLIGVWAAYSFYTVTEVARMTGAANYPECWSKAVSEDSRWAVQAMLTIAPLVGCVANTIILTDLLSGLMQTAGAPAYIYANRNVVAMLLCAGVLYPICSLPDLRALQGTSLLGLIGQLVAMAVVGVRMLDKSYLPGGKFAVAAAEQLHQHVATQSTPVLMRWFAFISLVCFCNVTHYNAPKYLTELLDNSRSRTAQMVGFSYLSAVLIYVASMYLGVAAFGGAVKPYLLSNLSARDPLAVVARLSVAASILASTPLMFMGVRNWLVGVAQRHAPALGGTKRMAGALVFTMGALATRLTDIGKIGSLLGALFGTTTMFTCPAIMYIGALRKRAKATGVEPNRVVLGLNYVLAACGAALCSVATYNSISILFK